MQKKTKNSRKDRTTATAMAATTSFLASIGGLSTHGWTTKRDPRRGVRAPSTVVAVAQQQQRELEQEQQQQQQQDASSGAIPQPPQGQAATVQQLPRQPAARSKNMGREYGSQWLSCVTRHVRIYAAYIDPVTHAFDQSQMDKLTLILDPTNEFVWTADTCQKVYSYFQELVDYYEGSELSEYTLRLIGSDVEHYIRKLLYDGEIKYNLNARVLNFSMGKPRVKFNSNDIQNAQPK